MPAETRPDWPRLAARIAFAAFLCSLLLGLLLPVYTDEVGWRMQLRAGIDGGFDRMLSDICGPNTIAAPPWFMWPHRWVTGWLNLTFADPLYVRIVGVASALGWAFALRAVIARIAAPPPLRHALTALAFGLLGFGVLPIMLVMSRPDALVLLCVTLAILATVLAGRAAARARWLWPLAVALLGVLALSAHLKGILFAPVFLLCLFFACPAKAALWKKLAALLFFALITLQAANYWVERFRCPGDPVLAGMLAQQNVASILAGSGQWQDKLAFALQGASPNSYIVIAEARAKPMSGWLPPGRIGLEETLLRIMPMSLAWNLAMLLALFCLVRALQQRWRRRRLDFAFALPVTVTGLILVWGISQLTKNDYEAMVVLPMLALAIVFAAASIGWSDKFQRWLGVAGVVVAALSLTAQIDIVRRFAPPLLAAAKRPGYVTGQPYSVSPYGYGKLRETIRAAARQCGIGAHGRAIRPLIDDTTYFALADSLRPFHQLNVIGKWKGRIGDPIDYIRSQGSEGAIMGCHNLPENVRARAIHSGEFCCVSAR